MFALTEHMTNEHSRERVSRDNLIQIKRFVTFFSKIQKVDEATLK